MGNDIYLIWQPKDKDERAMLKLYDDEEIHTTIHNLRERNIASYFTALIKKDEEAIGFIHLVDEGVENTLFVDLGIKEKYRGLGYGKRALELLKQFIEVNLELQTTYVIGETTTNNIAAIKAADAVGVCVYKNGNSIYHSYNVNFGQGQVMKKLNNKR